MARYVILYFEENGDADAFLEGVHPLGHGAYEIKALVPAPTLWCDMAHGGKKTDIAYTRGKKYHWWVCRTCGKPTKAWGSSYSAVVSAGVNLLDRDQDEPPRGWAQGPGNQGVVT